jgi:hypothetical protein
MLSGSIHQELAETNVLTACEAILEVVDVLAAGIIELEKCFGQVHVVSVPGNHSRLSMKPQAKMVSRKNYDWLIAKILVDKLSGYNVTWQISEGPDARFRVMNTTFLATHGDQFRGGSGISGMATPLALGDHRKRKRASAMKLPYDWMLMGHWHQLILGLNGIIVNGSVKGYDEYAYRGNFGFEVPQQAFWLVDPEHGVTLRAPIRLLDSRESWRSMENGGAAMAQGLRLNWKGAPDGIGDPPEDSLPRLQVR